MSDNQDPTTQAVVKASPEAFLLFDRQDDAAVVARVNGAALKEMVYAFKQRGATVYGLGIDGAEECKRELARQGEVIRIEDVDMFRETPDEAYFRAKASRWSVNPTAGEIRLDSTIEMKRQEKYITKKDGSQEPDPFWLEKGCSKASRNAVLNLIPERVKHLVIDRFKQSARIVEPTPDQVDADVAKFHATMDAKDERDKKITDLRDAWVSKELTPADVKKRLRDKGLSESLAGRMRDASAWATVDEAVIDDLLAEAQK